MIEAGTQLGRYEIRSQLGAGGMGEVYLGRDRELDRDVAIKILPEALAADQQRLHRFIQEAKAASALNHPHILTIYEIGTSDRSRFIVTEFIDGETLRERMKARMRLSEALEFSIQTAGALAAAHAAGIIHRDIKPENIMVRRDGYVKVLDFGLAKLTATESSSTDPEAATRAMVNTGAGTVMGTASYMSPEQAKGTSIDARSDIWSLGAVLYEMVAGCVPFKGETPTETISLILLREALPLSHHVPDAPAELDRIVTKTLTKDREERYQTMKDLLIDLRNLKRKLEVDAEIDRTVAPNLRGPATSTGSGYAAASAAPATVQSGVAASASSAEYLVGGIVKHKIIAALIALVLVGGVIGLGAYWRSRSPASSSIDSIAVLPFVNQSRDPDSEYISDGVTESIINSLTQIPNLKVIARSSVFRYKGKDIDPLAAGKELGVRAVLTGRIVQRGDSLTISTELVDVRDNKQIWGDQYNEKIADLLGVQREIAKQITSNLQVTLTGEQKSRVDKHYTDNAEAYQLYLKGRFYWNKRTADALKKAAEYFNQAIERDPNYALAYSGLADTYGLLPGYSGGSSEEYYPRAKAAAMKAVALDDNLAEAHTSLAVMLGSYDWKWDDSEKEFKKAIALNPNYATAHHWYSDGPLLSEGRFAEANAEMQRAQELDPLSLIINSELGGNYIFERQYDKAIDQLRRALDLDPNFYYARWNLGIALNLKGSYAEALNEFETAEKLSDDPLMLGFKGNTLVHLNRRADALKVLDKIKELPKQQYVDPYTFVLIYEALGDKDQAFQWLDKCVETNSPEAVLIKVDPLLDPLRSDPKFADYVRRVGLTP